jgi:putative phosphoesterase
MKRIGVLSDTHGHMDDRILHHLTSCDEIWHAGDIGNLDVTDALVAVAPLRAVFGNIDDHRVKAEFPEDLFFECEGMQVWITHIAGRPGRYNARTRSISQQRKPDILVCGHSHILLVQYDQSFNHLHLNPGAAGIKGFHKKRTLLRFNIHQKQLTDMEVIELERCEKDNFTQPF